MTQFQLTAGQIEDYGRHLLAEERSRSTVEKYLRDAGAFLRWLEGRTVTREAAAEWKGALLETGCAPATVNAKLSALNGLFRFLGWEECRVKFLKVQRRLFRDAGRELTKGEYRRLTQTAASLGRRRLELILQTLCVTGIRVSEVKYITLEAARQGKAEIALKGKIRTILIPGKLCRKLIRYARAEKIASGEIFLTRGGRSLSRKQIWAQMKAVCRQAGVEASKVFPHNLRHLFARCFYQVCRDVAKLADVLGHSCMETTRIYLISTGAEHAKTLEMMRLVS